MTVMPEILRAKKEIRDMLWRFDFVVVDNREYGPVWFYTAPLEPFEIVAQRSTGCVYALTGAQRHVLLATSEGQAGIMAASLQECLELVIAHPYWQDVLRFGKGDLPGMKLGLAEPRDPLKLLHHAVMVLGAKVIVRDSDGYPSEPLAGRFKGR